MEKDTQFIVNVVDAFVQGRGYFHDLLYVYGLPRSTAELAEQVFQAYRVRNPEARICREDGSVLHPKIIDRIKRGQSLWTLEKADCDLLILEHIEGIAGQETSEEVIYMLLDNMLLQGRQILVTGNVPVPQLLTLAPRICAQLSGGINLPV